MGVSHWVVFSLQSDCWLFGNFQVIIVQERDIILECLMEVFQNRNTQVKYKYLKLGLSKCTALLSAACWREK